MIHEERRIHALDGARAFATALVVLLHGLLSFLETPIGWAIKDHSTHLAADFVVWVGRAFLMPVFFLLSGMVSRRIVLRGGLRGFARERAVRVLAPLLAALVPVSAAMNALWDHGRALEGRAAVGNQVPALRASELPVTLAHLWFLYYLLLLSTLAAVLPRRPLRWPLVLPGLAIVPVSLVLLAAGKLQLDTPLSFLVEPSIAAYFVVFFVWGWLLDPEGLEVYAQKLPWLLGLALVLLASLVPALVASTAEGAPARAPAWALVTSAAFSCVSVAVFLGTSGRLVTRERPLVRRLADASYFTYVTHLPLVVLLQIAASRLAWPGPLKYAGVVTITGAVCLGSFVLLRAARRASRRSAGLAPRSADRA
ncbi:acyltransferase family protein [Polyangium spumosum]|uniref:Acyltransferase family protein n=1 Tax=Polyangium spumosum TaxID=889282 RepID=A0A6N7PMM0_9BACT|nr:acyltransferase family protein [Polyangium spumosum]MRG93159.1 acyltransferase family protein [Polyangium spumosum]